MARFLMQRLGAFAMIILLLSVMIFGLLAGLGVDPAAGIFSSDKEATMEDYLQLRRLYGLDDPFPLKYAKWAGAAVRGDVGYSQKYKQPVAELIPPRLANTLILAGWALVIAIVGSVVLRREQPPQAAGRGPGTGQRDAARAAAKKLLGPAARRHAVCFFQEGFAVSQRRACGLVGIPPSTVRYQPQVRDDASLGLRLGELARERSCFGYRRLHLLFRREGYGVNHKRVLRLYRLAGLSLRRQKRKRMPSVGRGVADLPTRPNAGWPLDFVSDTLAWGRRIRCHTVVDCLTRESPAIEVDTSLPGIRVVRVLETLARQRGLPQTIVMDNGSELTSRVLDQ
jgi:hypothetical protein